MAKSCKTAQPRRSRGAAAGRSAVLRPRRAARPRCPERCGTAAASPARRRPSGQPGWPGRQRPGPGSAGACCGSRRPTRPPTGAGTGLERGHILTGDYECRSPASSMTAPVRESGRKFHWTADVQGLQIIPASPISACDPGLVIACLLHIPPADSPDHHHKTSVSSSPWRHPAASPPAPPVFPAGPAPRSQPALGRAPGHHPVQALDWWDHWFPACRQSPAPSTPPWDRNEQFARIVVG